ncbi:MAG: hypothetical protein WED15_03300 [Akkermansiaceae bacterium]
MKNENQPYTRKTSHAGKEDPLNRDPISGEPGAHPVGTGVGAAGGAAAGVALGAAGGPAGMAIGGVLGALAGGVTGNAVAEGIDPTAEDAYWSENYRNEPYYQDNYDYPDYEPAYRMGYQSYGQQTGRRFEDRETDLSRSWDSHRGNSRLEWEHARPAARAGWDRVQRAHPGDGDDVRGNL